jgi:predicted 3-demethylubiquinone-9 3-methyltransferase (glyoxalase superfamily)
MKASTQKIMPCIWYRGDAEAAAKFYVSLLPNSRINKVFRSPVDYPGGKKGQVLTVEFTLAGSRYLGLNGGAEKEFQLNQGVSFQIFCKTQAEVDRLWNALKRGGKTLWCGWLRDRWGLTWQIVPTRLTELMSDPDPDRARRTMEAMMTMEKHNIAALEKAAGPAKRRR